MGNVLSRVPVGDGWTVAHTYWVPSWTNVARQPFGHLRFDFLDADDIGNLVFPSADPDEDFRCYRRYTISPAAAFERARASWRSPETGRLTDDQLRSPRADEAHLDRPNGGHPPQRDPIGLYPTPTRTRGCAATRRHRAQICARQKAAQAKLIPSFFFFLLLLFTGLLTLPTGHSTRIIFDDIGDLAASVNYAHIVAPLNINVTAHHAVQLGMELQTRFDNFRRRFDSPYPIAQANDVAHLTVTSKHIERSHNLFDRLRKLRQFFPFDFRAVDLPVRPTTSFLPEEFIKKVPATSPRQKNKRFVPFLLGATKLVASVFSSVNGWFTRKELKQLRREMATIGQIQHRTLQLTTANTVAIALTNTNLKVMEDEIANALLRAPAINNAEVELIFEGLNHAVDVIVQTIQEAKGNRLAVEFLSPEVLESVYNDVKNIAATSECQILLEQAADLWNVEVSYISDELGTVLILHVPMVAEAAILRLLRLRPFPIPLENGTSLIPEITTDVIGISRSKGYSAEIKYSDLIECHKIGRTYYCEKQNILTDTGDSCLTALHYKKLDLAVRRCELKVKDSVESVTSMGNNQYLVYSPISTTASRICVPAHQSASIDIPLGISTLHLPAGCRAELAHHRLFASGSITVDTNQFSYLWNWDSSLNLLKKHIGAISNVTELLRSRPGPLSLHDVIAEAEQFHQELMESELSGTLGNLNTNFSSLSLSVSDASRQRSVLSALTYTALGLGSALFIAGLIAAFFMRQQSVSLTAVRHILRRMPNITKLFRTSTVTPDAESPSRLYPDLDPECHREFTDFYDLLQRQSRHGFRLPIANDPIENIVV